MKFIDLFCGIGGFRLGLERATESIEAEAERAGQEDTQGLRGWRGKSNNERDKGLGSSRTATRQRTVGGSDRQFNCVWANDNDKYACQVYRKHFEEVYEGDIRAVDASAIPDHDLLCAGFPCQSFSIAGKRRGFEDTRGTLFFEICRIIRAKRPGYLFLENVKGLLSHDDGHTFETIIGTLDELGYDCQWQVLNSKDFGVPQNRERVFIIGHLGGQPRPKVFPVGETDRIYTEPDGQVSHAIDGNYHKGWLDNQQRTMVVQRMPLKYMNRNQKNIEGDWAFTIDSVHTGGIKQETNIRRLTPLECERLQGFPDGWTEGISDTQRYKCLGNAVTVNVIEAIGRQWLESGKEVEQC